MPRIVTKPVQIALSHDALFGKAKAYVGRALLRRAQGDTDEYQLWASLALELLGKALLAGIHPSLVVDPTHSESLFAASGINISTDVKTITAKTLFERLRHIAPRFDEKVKKFCVSIALRRNAELHSGETPFKTMRLDAWEAQYWHAGQIILEQMDATLEDWLGATAAKAPTEIVKQAAAAKRQAVEIRVERAREEFEQKRKTEREKIISDATSRGINHYADWFSVSYDKLWEVECPSCRTRALLAGVRFDEEVVDTYGDEHGAWEEVETQYSAEEFMCPACELFLTDSEEIENAGLEVDFTETEERELSYEQEYGND